MRTTLFLILSLTSSLAWCQDQLMPDSTYHRIVLLDSMWTRGARTKLALKDSMSYIELKGDRAELRTLYKDGERFERGRIARLRTTVTGPDTLITFYLVERGAFKGSWTIELKLGKEASMHITSPFATYDRFFNGRRGHPALIIRPEKKAFIPKAHDRTVQ